MICTLFKSSFVFAGAFQGPKKMEVTKGNKSLIYTAWTKGESFDSDYYKLLSIKSSNMKIASVDEKGIVKAKKVGTTKITIKAKIGNGKMKKRTYTIKVKKKVPVKNQYKYKVIVKDGKKAVELIKYIGCDSLVQIPKKINGYEVTQIADKCFGERYYVSTFDGKIDPVVTNISMGDNIGKVGNYAFLNCIRLSKVNLSNNLVNVGDGIFENTNIKDINIDQIYKICEIPADTFYRQFNQNATNYAITIPANVKSIGENAYAFNMITSINLNEGMEIIKSSAFEMNGTIYDNTYQEITIPSTVKEIGANAFSCDTLTKVTVLSKDVKIDNQAFKTKLVISRLTDKSSYTVIKLPLKIYGYKGSTAQQWAIQNEVEFVELQENMYQ